MWLLGAKVPLLFRVSVGLLVGGGVALFAGILMVYVGARRRSAVSPESPETPALTEKEGEKPEVGPDVMN